MTSDTKMSLAIISIIIIISPIIVAYISMINTNSKIRMREYKEKLQKKKEKLCIYVYCRNDYSFLNKVAFKLEELNYRCSGEGHILDKPTGTYIWHQFYNTMNINPKSEEHRNLICSIISQIEKEHTFPTKEEMKYREEQDDRLLSLGATNIKR